MKLYTQDRRAIVEMPRELWVPECSNGIIVTSGYVNKYLGEYATVERAKEVLHEIFTSYEAGKSSYILPLE